MFLGSAQYFQAIHDLADFWKVYQHAFDPRSVSPDPFARYRGLTITGAVPIPDQALVETGGKVIDSTSGFLLDRTAKRNILDMGLNPEMGMVICGEEMPADFAERLKEGFAALNLKTVVVKHHQLHGETKTGLFIDVGQPGYSQVMSDFHVKLPEADIRLVNHTRQAGDFLSWLEEKKAECALGNPVKLTLDQLPEYAQKAVFAAVLDDVIRDVRHELTSRSSLSMRRLNDCVSFAYGIVPGFSQLIEQGFVSADRTDPVREALMNACEAADTASLKEEIKTQFTELAQRSISGRTRGPASIA